MTLTTVGYHLQPHTFLGKLACGLCALTGVFIITLPIPIGGGEPESLNKIKFPVLLKL